MRPTRNMLKSFAAIRVHKFGGPEVLELGSVEEPELSDKQVLVKLVTAGVNPIDTYIRSGTYAIKPPFPYTPGIDGAGEIEKIGSNVEGWKCGDRVYLAGSVTGTYAEKTICEEEQLHHLPDNISFEQGSAIYISYATAVVALIHRAKMRPGETVLIHGASGGVGLAAVQVACAHGLRVIGTSSSQEGLEAIRKHGGEAYNHSEADYEDKIVMNTNGKGVDIIIEMLSNVNLEKDISTLVAPRGRIVVVGCRGTIEINPRSIMSKNSSVIGMNLLYSSPSELQETFAYIQSGLKNGTLSPVISTFSFNLNSTQEAHKHIIDRPPGTIGKVILHLQ